MSVQIHFERKTASKRDNVCCGAPITISRTHPCILQQKMSSYVWEEFCDQMDRALAPLPGSSPLRFLPAMAFLLTAIVVTILILLGHFDIRSNMIYLIVGFAVLSLVSTGQAIFQGQRVKAVLDQVKMMLEDTSKRLPDVRMSLCEEKGEPATASFISQYYIQVVVADHPVVAETIGTSSPDPWNNDHDTETGLLRTPVFGGTVGVEDASGIQECSATRND